MKHERFYTQEEVDNHRCTYKFNNRFKDLQGKTTDQITVIKLWGKERKHTWWFCQCTCGNIVKRSTNQINSRTTLRCSACTREAMSATCKKKSDRLIPLITEKFPHITLITRDTRRWTFHCGKCNTEFRESQSEMIKDNYKGTPCKCDNGVKFTQWTQKMREDQVIGRCKLIGAEFLYWEDGGYVNNTSRVWLKCKVHQEHKPWDVSINNLVGSAVYGCPECGVIRRADSSRHTLEKFILDATAVHGDKFNYDHYKYVCSRTPSKVVCNNCGKSFKVSYDNHVNKGRGCPGCSNRTQRQTYIVLISDVDHNTPLAIKYGKANDSEKRLGEHIGNTSHSLDLVGVWEYEHNINCTDAENFVKRNIGGNFLSQKDISAGYTETLSVFRIEDVIKVYEEFGGNRIL